MSYWQIHTNFLIPLNINLKLLDGFTIVAHKGIEAQFYICSINSLLHSSLAKKQFVVNLKTAI